MGFRRDEQYGKIRSIEYIADTKEDLDTLPKSPMGSTCFVISETNTYMCNSKNEWILQKKPQSSSGSSGSSVDLSNYMTREEVQQAIAAATQNALSSSDLKTINGYSLVGSGDLKTSLLIPDEEITSEEELDKAISQAMTIEEI